MFGDVTQFDGGLSLWDVSMMAMRFMFDGQLATKVCNGGVTDSSELGYGVLE
jgi:hypothetical protein